MAGRQRRAAALVGLAAAGSLLADCAPASVGPSAGGGTVRVVAAENFWGSIAAQIGGSHARVTSVISKPDTDPHSYEPNAVDARSVAEAQLVIENGIGYDPWVPKLLSADASSATVLDVGRTVGVADGGNPHRWYDPTDVRSVSRRIALDLEQLDPADRAYFSAQETSFENVGLQDYDAAIAEIRAKYAGTPVGASESVFAVQAPALGLDLVTPPSFLRAISEGTDVSAADKATIDREIRTHAIKVYVYNRQNLTPDIQAQLDEVKAAGIPYATITETLTPAGATFQDWQTDQLKRIEAALAEATGR